MTRRLAGCLLLLTIGTLGIWAQTIKQDTLVTLTMNGTTSTWPSQAACQAEATRRMQAAPTVAMTALCGDEKVRLMSTPPPPSPSPGPGPSPSPSPGPIPPGTDDYYISPTGSDTNAGTEAAPFKTLQKAFSVGGGGKKYALLPGSYSSGTGTGYLNSKESAVIPNGTAANPTYIHAKTLGTVFQPGSLMLGRSPGQGKKDSYIIIEGIIFDSTTDAAALLYNTSFITIRNSSFHSTVNNDGAVFDVGTNDGSWGNTDNLFEDIWIWGRARLIAGNYRADRNIWRRVAIRGDGCSSSNCNGSGNPNVGITVYDSQRVALQNVFVFDRILQGSGNGYADFAVAQHTQGIDGGLNTWDGTISLNAPDNGYYFEPDQQTLKPANTVRNCVAWNSYEDGISIARSGVNQVENCTVRAQTGNGVYMSNVAAGSYVKNILSYKGGSSGSVTPTNYGTNVTGQLYPPRTEAGTPAKNANQGANILTRVDQPTVSLWPWPNEALIKSQMCAGGVTRGLCGQSGTLTFYLWNQLGNGSPY